MNGVLLTSGAHWQVVYPDNAWATSETIESLKRAIAAAYARLPGGSPSLYIGDLSAQSGGPLSPHLSHQSGRDVDIGYFRIDPANRWWADASATTLDVVRTWIFLRALVIETDVEAIFIDVSLQRLLKSHALGLGEDAAWVERLFGVDRPGRPSLIRHEPQHRNHLHVRFYNPVAQRHGRAVHDLVIRGVERGPAINVPKRCLPPRVWETAPLPSK